MNRVLAILVLAGSVQLRAGTASTIETIIQEGAPSTVVRSGITDRVEKLYENDPHSGKLNIYIGGGSLIHPSVVLTAGHHAVNVSTLRVRAGEWDTINTKEMYPYQDRYVKSFVVHKDFNSGNMLYDVALLFLKSPMEMAPNVGVACLPPPEKSAKAGTLCFATGWGKSEPKGRYSSVLKKVAATVVDRKTCQDRLQTTKLGQLFQLDTSFMCAGAEPGKGTCKGDEGSPLVCPIELEKDRFVQNGIYAWGIECGETGTPGVYVDVSKVRNWIDEKIIEKGYQPEVYQYV